ncbi:AAA family ATPase [Thermodesulfobium sp. 4217-1]|uniref:AAA family ATPase n=1 Tax=Thermodesulfobium sp. 4217-1 TaxID=3120013 RepID=UPI0032220481
MIENIEFENFKCFERLSVEKLQRVNLIGGKNNIGKTAFLEGIELLAKPRSGFGMRIVTSEILRRRQLKPGFMPQTQSYKEFEFDLFNSSGKEIIIKDDTSEIKIKFIPAGEMIESQSIQSLSNSFSPTGYQILQTFPTNQPKIAPALFVQFSYNNETLATPVQDIINPVVIIRDIRHTSTNVNFISSCSTDETLLTEFYGKVNELDKEEEIDRLINEFDENILKVKAISGRDGTTFKLKLKNNDSLISLSSFGEGINRYIAILCAIWASQDGYLLIDEFENGIHYTNYQRLWKIIFETSKKANCQIFATTHSKECIEAFNEANQENEGVYLELYRDQKKNIISVMKRDYNQLRYSLTHEAKIRGE